MRTTALGGLEGSNHKKNPWRGRKDKIMTLGVIGEKLGMTQVFDEHGLAIPVTVIKVSKMVVTQVKTEEHRQK